MSHHPNAATSNPAAHAPCNDVSSPCDGNTISQESSFVSNHKSHDDNTMTKNHTAPRETGVNKKRKAAALDVSEIRAKKNECEKRRISEIADVVKALRKEVQSQAPNVDCSSKLSCLQEALALLQQQRTQLREAQMTATRMYGSGPHDPHSASRICADVNGIDLGFVFRNGSCATAVMSTSGTILEMNFAFQRLCGLTPQDKPSMISLTPPQELPLMMQAMSQLLVGNVPKVNLNMTCCSPYRSIAVNMDLTVVHEDYGAPTVFICSAIPRESQTALTPSYELGRSHVHGL